MKFTQYEQMHESLVLFCLAAEERTFGASEGICGVWNVTGVAIERILQVCLLIGICHWISIRRPSAETAASAASLGQSLFLRSHWARTRHRGGMMNKRELFQELRDELASAYTEELACVQSLLES